MLFGVEVRFVCVVTFASDDSTAAARPAQEASPASGDTRPRTLRSRMARTTAAMLGTVLVLAACADPASKVQTEVSQGGSASAAPTTAAPDLDGIAPELLPFYEQTVDWTSCGSGFECADIMVPLDWDDPTGETITIGAKRHPADETSMGTILINPGGPGGSGVEVVEYTPFIFGTELLDNFDILGVDPRGGPRRLELEEGLEAVHLGLVGDELGEHAGQPDRLAGQLRAHPVLAGGRRVALVEDQVDDRHDVVEAGHPLGAAGQLQVHACVAQRLLGARDPLSHRGLRDEEAARDLGRGQAADEAERQRRP